ncbi:MAG: hypothetical protein HN337_08555 [Deltaproteobacteria bacterium]|jgi:hypothetical protein|nr:hypothetical protein [Deltaproteobacteria bacterium]
MIGAGKLSPDNAKIPKVLQIMFCPRSDYDACGTHLQDTMVKLTDGMEPASVDRFVQDFFTAAAFEINQYCGDEFKPNTQPTKKCFYKSIKEGYLDGSKEQQGIFKGPGKFISWIEHLKKAAMDRGAPCAGLGDLKTPIKGLPVELTTFISELKAAGLPMLALIALNLFKEAMDDAGYDSKHDAAIVKSIKVAFQPHVAGITAEKDDTKKAVRVKDAREALGKFFVLKIKDSGELKLVNIPDAIWTSDKKALLRKYFKAALKIYKTKPKAMDLLNSTKVDTVRDKALNTLAAKVVEAVKAAGDKPKKVTDVTVDGDGYATAVVLGNSATPVLDAAPAIIADGIPTRLVEELNIGGNAHALMAIKRIWFDAMKKNPKIVKPGAIQNKAIDTIIAQLKGKSPWKIARAHVDKVEPNGAVHLKDIPNDAWADRFESTLNTLTPDIAYAVWERINQLYQAAATSTGRDAAKSTDDLIGTTLDALVRETLYGKGSAGAEKFFKLKFDSFDSKTHAPIYKEEEGKGSMPSWLTYKLQLKGFSNFDDFSGVVGGEVGGLHPVTPNLGITWGLGLKSGYEMDKFGMARLGSVDDQELLLQKGSVSKQVSILPKAMVGVTSLAKPKKGSTLFNWGIEGGITFDPYHLESNFLGVWAKGTLLLSDVGSVWARIGGGGLMTLDINGDGGSEVGPGFFDAKIGGSTKLWDGAKLDGWLWYLHAARATSPDVFAFDTTLTQELPKGFTLAAELFYGMNIGDQAPEVSVLYFNPTASWRSPNITSDFAFVLSANYDLLRVNGPLRHGVGPGVSFAKKDGSISFDLGYRYYMQDAADPKAFDQAQGYSTGDSQITADPGATGHYMTFGVTVKTP